MRRADPRRLIASSGVGNPGIPPGTGLWDEMAALAEVHGDDQALAAATSNAGRAFPQLRAGQVAPGHRCDLVLLGCDGDLAVLRRSIEGIVVAGTHSPIAAERERLDLCNEQADRRSP
jgi:cytosine/adenosine deaminase-related metal-dependent hydrolase